jgi:hypothetical protein
MVQAGVPGAEALWLLGPAKLMRLRQLPDALSIFYGYCERLAGVSIAGVRLLDVMFVRRGLAGVAVFGSAGDSGSTCNGSPVPGTVRPADSPYVTSVGGIRLVVNDHNERVNEFVWNDLAWITRANGGGGGVAFGYALPPYQRHIHISGNRRATPDLGVHGSMLPGYPIIAVYWLERHRSSAFYDVISGNSRYERRVPGHSAHRGYDLATGVGVPRFDRIVAPGAQTGK